MRHIFSLPCPQRLPLPPPWLSSLRPPPLSLKLSWLILYFGVRFLAFPTSISHSIPLEIVWIKLVTSRCSVRSSPPSFTYSTHAQGLGITGMILWHISSAVNFVAFSSRNHKVVDRVHARGRLLVVVAFVLEARAHRRAPLACRAPPDITVDIFLCLSASFVP